MYIVLTIYISIWSGNKVVHLAMVFRCAMFAHVFLPSFLVCFEQQWYTIRRQTFLAYHKYTRTDIRNSNNNKWVCVWINSFVDGNCLRIIRWVIKQVHLHSKSTVSSFSCLRTTYSICVHFPSIRIHIRILFTVTVCRILCALHFDAEKLFAFTFVILWPSLSLLAPHFAMRQAKYVWEQKKAHCERLNAAAFAAEW